MEIFATLGQYLLLAFVLRGFCYLLVFALCFPELIGRMRAWVAIDGTTGPTEKKDSSPGLWIGVIAVSGGLLLSSVAFAIEIVFRRISLKFDCLWFPAIPFDKIMENTLANFFTAESFMHFNIGVGILIILMIYLIYSWAGEYQKPEPSHNGTERPDAKKTRTKRLVRKLKEWRAAGRAVLVAARLVCRRKGWLAAGLAVLVAANLTASAHLFERAADVALDIPTEKSAWRMACPDSHKDKAWFSLRSWVPWL